MKAKQSLFLVFLLCICLFFALPWTVASAEEFQAAPLTEEADSGSIYPGDHAGASSPGSLLNAYAAQALEQQLPRNTMLKAKKNTASRLSGMNAAVYRELHLHICSVAAGEESSTVFSVDLSSLELAKASWTAEELGVSSLTETVDGKTVIASEAKLAVDRELDLDIDLILSVLLADCPYELYWYDKTQPTTWTRYGYSVQDGIISITGPLLFRFPVAAEYALDAYVVDSSYGASIHAAIERASAIAGSYSGFSDYDRLDGYRQEICSLVSYNHSAVTDGSSYGNPWQIIWVFDGDSTTNVVCEGYAKAFQYLCDLSDFQNAMTSCTVTGTINGEAHMWNLVTMENGKNYLVDITNCDGNMSGAPDYLFLAGHLSGDADTGYVCLAGRNTVTYQYDSETRRLYSAEELTLSERSYTGKYDGADLCPAGHDYLLDSWNWAEDESTAEAVFICSRSAGHTLSLPAVLDSHTEPADCETDGVLTVTASVTLDGTSYSDVRHHILPATGHSYGLDHWDWAENCLNASAVFICRNNAAHTLSADAVASVSLIPNAKGVLYVVMLTAADSPDHRSHRDSVIVLRTGWVSTSDGTRYYLDETGSAITGWLMIDNVWYYFSDSGAMQTGWLKFNNVWYYFSDSGAMQTGWLKFNNAWYYFSDSGAMQTGWLMIDNVWYYFSDSGAMQTGWLKFNNVWYYFSESGAMQTGWLKFNNAWYYFSESGAMQTGWLKFNNAWYYFSGSGAMQTGWLNIGGKTYYFKETGEMAASEWCEGWWLNADGTWTYPHKASWKENTIGKWFGDTAGWYAKNGTIRIDGEAYTFDASGYLTE